MKNRFFKRELVLGIILLFVGAGVIPSTVGIQKEKKSIQIIGSPGYIQDLIDNANPGDTIYIPSGIYYENIVIDKSISLIGEDKNTTIIDGSNVGDVVNITADWVNISGFTIQNSGEEWGDAGINLENHNSIYINTITITDNTISNHNYFSIFLRDNYNVNIIITGNSIFYNRFSILFYCCYGNNLISGNNISYNGGGIVYSYSDPCNISYNTISNNDYGINLGAGGGMIIHGNFISNNSGHGIYLGEFSGGNIITDNIISNNRGGIDFCWGNRKNVVTGNYISGNEYGVYIPYSFFYDCCDNIIAGNNIKNNLYGIYIDYNGYNNTIYHNNIINNEQNAQDEGNNTWDNGKSGNYWDDYDGEDNNGDGIGDTPYLILGGDNEDRYPLMEPWSGANLPPDTPEIEGKTSFKKGEGGVYTYTIFSTDPDSDYVCYLINWTDEGQEQTEYYVSGENFTKDVNIPLEKGTYVIFKTKAIDIFGAESDWATLEIIVPRNRVLTNTMWYHWFLERFPMLERLLSLL